MTALYLDMDGVVADWAQGASDFLGYTLPDPNARYPDQDWQRLKDHGRLFKTLPRVPKADQLVNLAREFRDQLGYDLAFLTAIPHGNDMPWTFTDKVLWAQEQFPDIPVFFGPYSRDKAQHCRPGDILVDDRRDNCKSWRAQGGIAILVTPSADLSDAILELRRLKDRCEAPHSG